jgi:predicted outer membrane repeat protein
MWFEKKRQPRLRRFGPIEALEGRAVPATFVASNVDQLVADVAALNNAPGPNTIILATGTYSLSAPLRIVNAGDLTIKGRANAAADVIISAGASSRVMEVDGGSVTLSAVTLTGGNSVAQGAGLLAVNANVTLKSSTVTANSATGSGGGIYAQGGTLNVVSSAVHDNTIGGTNLQGAGIAASTARVTVTNSSVNNNSADALETDAGSGVVATAQGGGIYTAGGTLDISGSKLGGNSVSAFSGGVGAAALGAAIATSGTTVTINQTGFQSNSVSSFAIGTSTAQGSALSAVGSNVTITASTFARNTNTPASVAGFTQVNSTVVIRHSTLGGRSLPGSYTLGDKTTTPTA